MKRFIPRFPVALGCASFVSYLSGTDGFTSTCLHPNNLLRKSINTHQRFFPLWYITTDLPDLSEMKAGEMKKELESYGVSTKSLFDKTEFEKALREERLHQELQEAETIRDRINVGAETSSSKTSDFRKNRKMWSKTAPESPIEDPQERDYEHALQKGIAMKLSELKQELKDRGISTSAFFEKVDLAKAYAQAIADNVLKKKHTCTKEEEEHRGSRVHPNARREDAFDPSFRDVIVQPFNAALTLNPGETVIDITDLVNGVAAEGNIWQ
jgi:predicted HTH domain antitoxin